MTLRARARIPRPDDGMNRLEAAWAQALRWMQLEGTVDSFYYEAVKLKLAGRTFYTPDFMVVKEDGLIEFHEVKGFMRDDANVKLKVAARTYPLFAFVLVRRPKKAWVVEEIAP